MSGIAGDITKMGGCLTFSYLDARLMLVSCLILLVVVVCLDLFGYASLSISRIPKSSLFYVILTQK